MYIRRSLGFFLIFALRDSEQHLVMILIYYQFLAKLGYDLASELDG